MSTSNIEISYVLKSVTCGNSKDSPDQKIILSLECTTHSFSSSWMQISALNVSAHSASGK